MVKLNKIYTRKGDAGDTSLTGGRRVRKNDLRVEAFGSVDEANAAIGMARAYASDSSGKLLARVQNDLFDLGADLSTPDEIREGQALRIVESQIRWLEEQIDFLNAGLEPLESFVLPGGAKASAFLHLARTVVRRAERLGVALAEKENVNPEALKYLNRLSDFLFVLARFENGNGKADVLWKPGKSREG